MAIGGTKVDKKTAMIIRFVGFIVPFGLLLYGFLIQNGIVVSEAYVSDTVFYIVMVPWIIISIYQLLIPSKSLEASALRLALYHALAASYLLFISGFAIPFVATWALLFFATYAYFGDNGLRFSIMSLVIVVIFDSAMHVEEGGLLTSNITAMMTVLLVGIAAIGISRIQETQSGALDRSKALEALERDRILTLINNLADAVLSTDEHGIIQVYNAASLNLLDTNSSLNGRHISEILPLKDITGVEVNIADDLKKSQGVVVRDDTTLTFDDETVRLEVTYSPIRGTYTRSHGEENEDGYIIILRDITKSKSLEEERDEFISVISHELRTPITVVEGTVSNVQLMMERPDIPQSKLKESLAMAHDQVVFLAKMVNDLSTLSRAERGVADVAEDINVRILVDDLYNEYSPQAKAKNLHFNLDASPSLGTITASKLYIQELLQNFITNAIKYTKEGSVTLIVTKHADSIKFAVKDTGIGISKSDQAKVFNKFYRSEDYRTRETGGTGLGLYVAMKLAKKLGCEIDLTSRLNHGSTFRFTLPLKK
ncbi:MAG: ATP-binding protein [Candidatus Saccharimonadales bacterium]